MMSHRLPKACILCICCFLFAEYTDLHAQIWENANKTHRSTSIVPVSGKVVFSLSNHLFFSSDLGHSFTVDEGSASGGVTGFAIGSFGKYYFSAPSGLFSSPAYDNMNNENWTMIDSSNIPAITSLLVRNAPDFAGADEIFIGTKAGLWRRTTNSGSWTKIHDAGDGDAILQIAAFNKSIYYRTLTSVWASSDGGSNWSSIAGAVSNADKTSIVATSDTDLYIAINGFPGSHILHSTDKGNTFNGFRGIDFGTRTIQTLVANSAGDLYLGGGVRSDFNEDSIAQGYAFRFMHGAGNWEDYSAGLPSGNPAPEIIGMGFGANGNVFAGTDSAGLWRSLLPSGVQPNGAENGITISPMYPNPAGSSTEFSLITDHLIHASLEVVDAIGRNVLELANGEITPGSHLFRIVTSAMPNGTYYYRLQTLEGVRSGSFIVSK